jgi:hypothetical protein
MKNRIKLYLSALFVFLIYSGIYAQDREERIIFHYLKLSSSLSDSDLKQSVKHAGKLASQLDQPAFSSLQASADAMKKATGLNQLRESFSVFSDSLSAMVKSGRLKPAENLYLVHCPMAFNDKGADWISDVPKVINPYFGDEMLHCGKVKSTLFKSGKQ